MESSSRPKQTNKQTNKRRRVLRHIGNDDSLPSGVLHELGSVARPRRPLGRRVLHSCRGVAWRDRSLLWASSPTTRAARRFHSFHFRMPCHQTPRSSRGARFSAPFVFGCHVTKTTRSSRGAWFFAPLFSDVTSPARPRRAQHDLGHRLCSSRSARCPDPSDFRRDATAHFRDAVLPRPSSLTLRAARARGRWPRRAPRGGRTCRDDERK